MSVEYTPPLMIVIRRTRSFITLVDTDIVLVIASIILTRNNKSTTSISLIVAKPKLEHFSVQGGFVRRFYGGL